MPGGVAGAAAATTTAAPMTKTAKQNEERMAGKAFQGTR